MIVVKYKNILILYVYIYILKIYIFTNNYYRLYMKDSIITIKKSREEALWRAVILQAFIDMKNNSKKKLANTFRVKATLWFNLKNKDFLTVCNYANLDPYYVWKKAEIIKNNNYNKYIA